MLVWHSAWPFIDKEQSLCNQAGAAQREGLPWVDDVPVITYPGYVMSNMNRRLTILAFSAMLTACATTDNVKPEAIDITKDNGYVLFTVTHDWGPPALIFKERGMGSNVWLRVEFTNHFGKTATSYAQSNNSEGFTTPSTSFEKLWGSYYVRELPPGTYALSSWEIWQVTGVGTRSFRPSKTPRPLAFEVQKGSITYIGNIHAGLQWGNNLFGIPLVTDVMPEIKNMADRDLPIIYNEYHQLRGRVKVAPLEAGLWLNTP
jgi:hypothetical protein